MEKSPTAEQGAMSEQSSAPASLKDYTPEGNDATTMEKPTANTAVADVPAPPTTIAEETKPQSQPDEYVTGMKLWTVMIPLCLAFFLVLLDTSILATVSIVTIRSPNKHSDIEAGHPSHHERLQQLAGCRVVRFRLSTVVSRRPAACWKDLCELQE